MEDNEDLVVVQLFMLNIAITCGFSPMGLNKSMNVMLTKDEGHNKIERMCIIQIFEADLIFSLSHI